MITELALMSLYRSPTIRLDEISQQYLNLSPAEAAKRAARAELPFPAFRLGPSQKAPWVVSAEELGRWIDQASEEARKQWQRVQPEPLNHTG